MGMSWFSPTFVTLVEFNFLLLERFSTNRRRSYGFSDLASREKNTYSIKEGYMLMMRKLMHPTSMKILKSIWNNDFIPNLIPFDGC